MPVSPEIPRAAVLKLEFGDGVWREPGAPPAAPLLDAEMSRPLVLDVRVTALDWVEVWKLQARLARPR